MAELKDVVRDFHEVCETDEKLRTWVPAQRLITRGALGFNATGPAFVNRDFAGKLQVEQWTWDEVEAVRMSDAIAGCRIEVVQKDGTLVAFDAKRADAERLSEAIEGGGEEAPTEVEAQPAPPAAYVTEERPAPEQPEEPEPASEQARAAEQEQAPPPEAEKPAPPRPRKPRKPNAPKRELPPALRERKFAERIAVKATVPPPIEEVALATPKKPARPKPQPSAKKKDKGSYDSAIKDLEAKLVRLNSQLEGPWTRQSGVGCAIWIFLVGLGIAIGGSVGGAVAGGIILGFVGLIVFGALVEKGNTELFRTRVLPQLQSVMHREDLTPQQLVGLCRKALRKTSAPLIEMIQKEYKL